MTTEMKISNVRRSRKNLYRKYYKDSDHEGLIVDSSDEESNGEITENENEMDSMDSHFENSMREGDEAASAIASIKSRTAHLSPIKKEINEIKKNNEAAYETFLNEKDKNSDLMKRIQKQKGRQFTQEIILSTMERERKEDEDDRGDGELQQTTSSRWPSGMREERNFNWFIVPFFYFLLGVYLALPSLAITYYAKEVLKIGPSTLGVVTGLIMSPWFAKPLFGLVSDSSTLWGYHRKSYLLVCSAGACVTWLILSSPGKHSDNMIEFGLLMFASNFFICVCDVMVDCILARQAREEMNQGGRRGSTQSMAWFLRHGGSFIGSCAGALGMSLVGSAKTHEESSYSNKKYIQRMFFATSILPLLLFIASLWLYEEKVYSLGGEASSTRTHSSTMWMKIKARLLRTWENQKRSPFVLNLAIFIFIFAATPSSSQAVFYFIVNKLGFSKKIMGLLDIMGVVSAMVGLAVYRYMFHDTRTRTLLSMGIIIGTIISLTQLVFILRWTRYLGISDVVFASADDIASSFASQLTMMPLLVAAAAVCPSGDEGLLYAGLMSASNFGGAVSSWGGAALTDFFGVTSQNFDRLWILVVVCSLLNIAPLFLLHKLPSEECLRNKESQNDDLVAAASTFPGITNSGLRALTIGSNGQEEWVTL